MSEEIKNQDTEQNEKPSKVFTKQKTQRKLLYLAFFLGFLGIHDFYAGNKKNGFVKLVLLATALVFWFIPVSTSLLTILIFPVLTSLLSLASGILIFIDIVKIVKNKYSSAANDTFLQNAVKSDKIFSVFVFAVGIIILDLRSFLGSLVLLFTSASGAQGATLMEQAMKSFVLQEIAFIVENNRAGYLEEIGYDKAPMDLGAVRIMPDQDRNKGYVQLLGGFVKESGGCKAKTGFGITFLVKKGSVEAACAMTNSNGKLLSPAETKECLAEMPEIKTICKGFQK